MTIDCPFLSVRPAYHGPATWPTICLALFLLLAAATPAAAFDLIACPDTRAGLLPGIAAALAAGVGRIALDVAPDAEGRLVVTSDSWLDRPATGSTDGGSTATLAEVVALIRQAGSDHVGLALLTRLDPTSAPAIEPMQLARAVMDELGRLDVIPRTILLSFDWRTLQAARQLDPSLATGCLTVEQDWRDNLERGRPGPSPWTAGLDRDAYDGVPALVHAAGCTIWLPWIQDLHALSLGEAHALRLLVIPWTVNRWETMAALLTAGIDGMITTHPDRLRQIMTEQGLIPPAALP